MEGQESKPPRRKRYKGTHPRTFHEKYKELHPEKYQSDIEKVLLKGKTPAGMHRSICVHEILEVLQIQPGQKGLDATLGYGGHSLEILKRLQPGGHLFATDVDSIELPKTKARLEEAGFGAEAISIRKLNFAALEVIVAESGPLHFVLADLGVSSMQIDNPERGFSMKVDGPLDLRLNPTSGKPASALLKKMSKEKLEEILMENADEIFAEEISEVIIQTLSKGKSIETTLQLKECIAAALEFLPLEERNEQVKKSCTRCFQALRIEVNNEFGVLEKFLSKLPDALATHGRVAILSFHSGEDRRVKKSFQMFFRGGIYKEISSGPILPSPQEIFNNPRARSAKLRWAVKG